MSAVEFTLDNGAGAIVVDGMAHPIEPGHLLEHPSGHVWLPERAWTVELTANHVRAESTVGQRVEWDRWQVLVYRVTIAGDVATVEAVPM
jgi:hypothetical protein